MGKYVHFGAQCCQKYAFYEKKLQIKVVRNRISPIKGPGRIWVVLQKLPQLSDTHFSQVLNKVEKNFFHGFIKYHVALHFI